MSEPAAEVVAEIRDRLCLVIDSDDLVAAARLAKQLRPWFGVAKVGLELYSAAGPDSVTAMSDLGYDVFVDLKLHDIPNTVGRAASVLGSLGARYVTMHAHGGVHMLRAGVEGLRSAAAAAELPEPTALAVTVLTSDDTAPPHVLPKRIGQAVEGGCTGVICAVDDIRQARQIAPRFLMVTTGIRMPGTDRGDQRRIATPAEAFAAGSDLVVVGRTVTAADRPAEAAAALVESVSAISAD